MPIDISQFHEGFFEEAAEHIERLEALLLELDITNPDSEKVNAIFRAAHSIKGGSGTFGLTAMKEFTHELESLLDRLRHGELRPSHAMIDLCLEAGDVLREQLARYRGGEPDDPVRAHDVGGRLRAFVAANAMAVAMAAPQEPAHEYDLAFRTTLTGGQRGAAYDGLLSALRAIGSLSVREGQRAENETWLFHLTAPVQPEEIYDIFEYVSAPGDDLTVTQLDDQSAPDSGDEGFGFFDGAPGVPASEDDAGFGFFDDAPGAPAKPAVALASAAARIAPGRAGWDGIDRRRADEGSSSIRVSLQKVDQLINLVGEMVISQSKVAKLIEELDHFEYQDLHEAIAQMQRNSRDLQDGIMSTRMLPIRTVFSRFPRMVHDLAATLGKEVVLTTAGDDTELDKGLLEQMTDPLTHLVRNSLDHGIESHAARIAAGKPPEGHITLRASHQGGNIVVEVVDDGCGLDRTKILAKARQRGLEIADDASDEAVWGLIFEAGFSTSEAVTDVSGRGVGMDVVKRNIDGLGGRIEIDSAAGQGTSITIRLPLTLAILDGLSVGVGSEVYILPLAYIIESIQVEPRHINTVGGSAEVIAFRDEYVPLMWLSEFFHIDGTANTADQGIVVLVEASGKKAGLVVDSLENQHQVVVKSLSANYRKVRGISGATILGNGRVTLILDVPGLLHSVQPASRERSGTPALEPT